MTLQEKMNKALEKRFSSTSSPIYSLKLTLKVTPRGLLIFKISASAVRVNQKMGYPTPKTGTGGPNHNAPQVLAGNHGMNLEGMAHVVGWGTPAVMDTLPIRSEEALERAKSKAGCANLKDQVPTGQMSNGFIAETTSTAQSSQDLNQLSGQLNPALPRWLMGYPQEWCVAAVIASRLMPTKRKKRV